MKKELIVVIVVVVVSLSSFTLGSDSIIEYEYITITVDSKKPKRVNVSYSDGGFEELKVESSGSFDYSDVLKIINVKERDGFELFSNTFSAFGGNVNIPHNYFILRKRKN